MRSIGSTLVVIWLIIGVLAAFQRDYLTNREKSCAEFGTVIVTVVAGPLNYLGVNPEGQRLQSSAAVSVAQRWTPTPMRRVGVVGGRCRVRTCVGNAV